MYFFLRAREEEAERRFAALCEQGREGGREEVKEGGREEGRE
jgi:hypothetical protein